MLVEQEQRLLWLVRRYESGESCEQSDWSIDKGVREVPVLYYQQLWTAHVITDLFEVVGGPPEVLALDG